MDNVWDAGLNTTQFMTHLLDCACANKGHLNQIADIVYNVLSK